MKGGRYWKIDIGHKMRPCFRQSKTKECFPLSLIRYSGQPFKITLPIYNIKKVKITGSYHDVLWSQQGFDYMRLFRWDQRGLLHPIRLKLSVEKTFQYFKLFTLMLHDSAANVFLAPITAYSVIRFILPKTVESACHKL